MRHTALDGRQYGIFESSQANSGMGNPGAFDPGRSDVRFQQL